jgi:hypothetical protein
MKLQVLVLLFVAAYLIGVQCSEEKNGQIKRMKRGCPYWDKKVKEMVQRWEACGKPGPQPTFNDLWCPFKKRPLIARLEAAEAKMNADGQKPASGGDDDQGKQIPFI